MLGNPGSNPLELFWDIVDSMDQKLDAKILNVESVIKAWNEKAGSPNRGQLPTPFRITPDTTMEQFLAVVKSDRSDDIQKLTQEDLDEIFKTVCR